MTPDRLPSHQDPHPAMKPHPLSEIFPMLEGEELQALADDIKANGLRDPVVLHEGMILDGRNRWAACRRLRMKQVETVQFDGADPLAFVLSKNVHRRHMTVSQRAMLAAKLVTVRQGQRTDLAELPATLPEVDQAKAAELMRVGERTVRDAKAVQERGTAAEVEAVRTGTETVTRAAKIIHDKERDIRKAAADDPDRFGDLLAKLDGGGKVEPVHRELRKREAAGTRKKDVLKDATGADVPAGLRDLFGDPWLLQTAEALEKFSRDTLKAVVAKVTRKGPAYKFLLCSDILKSLAAAKHELDTAVAHLAEGRPHAVHRACEGKGCKDCRQAGWLPS